MAEFLVRSVDTSYADPVLNQTVALKRGNVVDVKPDGHTWGNLEAGHPEDFWIIRVVGVTVEQAKRLLEVDFALQTGVLLESRARRYTFEVPASWLPSLTSTGFREVTWNQVRQYIRDQRTGQTMNGASL